MSNDDKNTSDLKRLLQEKLANSEAAQDGWNVPSGGVWSGISEELNAAKPVLVDTRKPVWPWIAIGLLLTALLIRECSHHRVVSQMEQEMKQFQQECEEKLSQKKINRSPESTTNQQLAMGAAPVAFSAPTPPVIVNQRPVHWASGTAIGRKAVVGDPAVGVTAGSEKQVIQSNPSLPSNTAETHADELLALNTLPNKSLLAFHQVETKPNLNLPDDPITPRASNSLAWLGGAYAGIALTGNRLKGETPTIISGQKALMGWQTGVGLEAVINRNWSVLTGLNYNTSRIETDYNLAVPFTHNGEFQHDDGNYDNQYNHSLPSALGNYPLQMVLTRASDATIHEGEVMGLELMIRQKTQFLSVPLQLRYGLGKNKWQLGLRAGVVSNHVLAVESESPDLKPLHGAIHQRHTSIGAPKLADLEKWTFDYALGLDMRYHLSPRLALNLASGFQRGITPIYKDEALMNYLQATNLVLGFQYRLR